MVDAAVLSADFVAALCLMLGPVAIIVTARAEGHQGLVATAWTSLCAVPQMVVTRVAASASAHDLILRDRAFSINLLVSINLLDRADDDLGATFSNQRGLRDDARFTTIEWGVGSLGQPLLRSAVVSIEGALVENHRGGTMPFGAVLELGGRQEGELLIYRNGKSGVTTALA